MAYEIKIVRGPLTQGFSREAAAEKLEKLPGFPTDADYHIEEIDGRYVAAVVWPKEAAPFPPGGDEPSGPPTDEAPADDSEESGPPKKDEGESKEEGGEEPSSEGAPGEEGKAPSVEHQLANLTNMLTKIVDALGLSDPSGMVPGADEGVPGGPPHGAPKPGDTDPTVPGAQGPDGKTHTVHERSLKPNEAPPGTTPVGAPAFGSVQVDDSHPWKDAIEAGAKEFEVEAPIGDKAISAVAAELKELAEPYGLVVTDLAPSGEGASRTASARIVRSR